MSQERDGTRVEAAAEFRAARVADTYVRHLEELDQARARALALEGWRGRLRPLRRRRAALELWSVVRECRLDQDQLGPFGVGAAARSWGVLSSGARLNAEEFYLEQTLRDLLSQQHDVEKLRGLAPRIEVALGLLPTLRVDAQRNEADPADVQVLEQLLLDVAASLVPGGDAWHRVIAHLPGHRRPLPEHLTQLQCSTGLHHLFVSHNRSRALNRPWVPASWDWDQYGERGDPSVPMELHDIVVYTPGNGLGTAILEHLCRFADERGLEIYAHMIPGPKYLGDEPRLRRLAAWYYRHGFRHGDQPHDHWADGATLCRAPRAAPKSRGDFDGRR